MKESNGVKRVACVILAAGKGVRMKSNNPKALFELSGKAMVEFLIDIARSCNIKDIVVVGGYKIDLLKKKLTTHKVKLVEQRRLLGSADAVKQTKGILKRFRGTIVVLYADTPLIKPATVKGMLKVHTASRAAVTLLTAKADNPRDYGRILRDKNGRICGVVEQNDISVARRSPALRSLGEEGSLVARGNGQYEINVGAYCFDSKRLFEGLPHIKKNRIKKEFYLTDIISYFYRRGYPVSAYTTNNDEEMLGINRMEDLVSAEEILRKRTVARLLQAGVNIKDPESVYIQEGAKIAKDVVIYPFVVIERDVVIGKGCRVGPFTHLRQGTVLEDGSEIGNFVEVVRSRIGSGSKAKHHSYLGDALVGKKVNVGAGTITANYDGKKKNKTIIEDKAFIGSSTTIVAPVKIGRGAITGAGSVIVKRRDVPPKTTVVGVPAKPLTSNKATAYGAN